MQLLLPACPFLGNSSGGGDSATSGSHCCRPDSRVLAWLRRPTSLSPSNWVIIMHGYLDLISRSLFTSLNFFWIIMYIYNNIIIMIDADTSVLVTPSYSTTSLSRKEIPWKTLWSFGSRVARAVLPSTDLPMKLVGFSYSTSQLPVIANCEITFSLHLLPLDSKLDMIRGSSRINYFWVLQGHWSLW